MALVKAFLAAENENRQLEDLPQADLAVYLSRAPLRFDSSAFDYNVIPSLNFRILFHWIVALVSRAHLRFSFIGLLR